MWAIVIKTFHHPIPISCFMWKLHPRELLWWQYFEPPQMNLGDDADEKILEQVLVTATISRQHLTNKMPMKQIFDGWIWKSSSQSMELELPHRSEECENSMHYSQLQRYIVSMLWLFPLFLVFETNFDS